MSEEQNQQFAIQKIYLKDVSFESPNAPQSFMSEDWQPQVNIQLNTGNQRLSDGVYEVVLDITVTATQNEKTAFLVELKQAGIFSIINFPDDALAGMLGAYCPETLFPYAREAVSELVVKGGFPLLALAPVNFNAMFQNSQKQRQEAQQAEADSTH